MSKELYLGIDIGSVSVKIVLLSSAGAIHESPLQFKDNPSKQILYHSYTRSEGQPFKVLLAELQKLFQRFNLKEIARVATTGTGGKLAAELLGGKFVNEVISQVKATSILYPEVRTVIEMGGEDSKLLLLKEDDKSGTLLLEDFSMNTLCAAGTGSFLDQQAKRLKINIENEFGQLALKSKNPPRIAGRCSVFAKSDMIHLQQIATPDYDIVAGLCYAMARNFKSSIAQGKKLKRKVSFQGGVAANAGMVKAFRDVFELSEGELVIPEYHTEMGAIGAALSLMEDKTTTTCFKGLTDLQAYLTAPKIRKGKEKLHFDNPETKCYLLTQNFQIPEGKEIPAYLGIDVGSLSTNVVVIDQNRKVLSRRYLMTEGRPIEAVRRGLEEIGNEVGDKVKILGVGTTGSGRYLTGDFVGADIVYNEITAQARAAVELDPSVDTIFEIGGQDSKYISLDNGIIIDFEMNKVCAAGTGSFLQEQAEKLNINIEEEFGKLALLADSPVNCGERCTVFMESDLNAHQQTGVPKEDLVAGLAYSIVFNYLNKVVGKKKIGKKIFFQGGVAWNKGVVAAFEKVLGKEIIVPPHHDVTGAIGVAILAQERNETGKTNFKGFDLSKKHYQLETFECQDCANHCEIKKVLVEDQKPLYYGSRCEKYDLEKKSSKKSDLPDLFEEREKILFSLHREYSVPGKKKGKIGIPRALFFYEFFPFWATLFENLGYEVVLSDKTNKQIIRQGVETVLAETCYPIKVAHGHVQNLFEKKVNYILFPSLINLKKEQPDTESYCCPYVQALPYILKATYDFKTKGIKLLSAPVHFQKERAALLKELDKLTKDLKVSQLKLRKAFKKAESCQQEFYSRIRSRGEEILRSLKDSKAVLVVGRPYNTCDPFLSLELSEKLKELKCVALPLDSAPLKSAADTQMMPNMYWKYGQKILSASEFVKENPGIFPVYVTNFGCGPDSFILHFFKSNLGRKPFLQLELDEHSADAGIVTRCEAFLDSLKGYRGEESKAPLQAPYVFTNGHKKVLYIPYMAEHAFALRSAFRVCGVQAEVMPESDEKTVILGRKYTSGKECYPCVLTTGDIVKLVQSQDFDKENSIIFMPQADGPCRFGQYQNLQRIILDELGYKNVPICSPHSKDSYDQILNLGDRFRRIAWRGLVIVDLLNKLLWKTRPYEINPGDSQKAYWECLDETCSAIEKKDDLEKLTQKVHQIFSKVKTSRNGKKPLIGVVGEIYIRSNRFSNHDVVNKIEKLGGEARIAPMAEWFFYTNFMYKDKTLSERNYGEFIKAWLTDRVQKKDEEVLYESLKEALEGEHELPVERILELASPYLHYSFGGEAILSVGKSIDFIKKGFCGVVNTMPFTCMPGTVVSAISKKIREEYHNFPWLDIAYEGLEDSSELTRLEAFMYQAKEMLKKVRRKT
ncbi:MAG TPA: acyl-CoA dehydratase activase [Terriglobales bacterium]|nr:acyl-CoA dehydratase activase [Terriglobales bacterium]